MNEFFRLLFERKKNLHPPELHRLLFERKKNLDLQRLLFERKKNLFLLRQALPSAAASGSEKWLSPSAEETTLVCGLGI